MSSARWKGDLIQLGLLQLRKWGGDEIKNTFPSCAITTLSFNILVLGLVSLWGKTTSETGLTFCQNYPQVGKKEH